MARDYAQRNSTTCSNFLHTPFSHLAKVIQVTSSQRTSPEEVSNSANSLMSIPSSSCFLNWIPALASISIESWAYMSSLHIQTRSRAIVYRYLFATTLYTIERCARTQIPTGYTLLNDRERCQLHTRTLKFYYAHTNVYCVYTFESNAKKMVIKWTHTDKLRTNVILYLPKTELEVELESTHPRRSLTLAVVERQSQLNEFKEIDVALKQLVLIIGIATKLSNRLGNNTRKLGVL